MRALLLLLLLILFSLLHPHATAHTKLNSNPQGQPINDSRTSELARTLDVGRRVGQIRSLGQDTNLIRATYYSFLFSIVSSDHEATFLIFRYRIALENGRTIHLSHHEVLVRPPCKIMIMNATWFVGFLGSWEATHLARALISHQNVLACTTFGRSILYALCVCARANRPSS